jgi:DNA-binding Lrp family transcriptional regulator
VSTTPLPPRIKERGNWIAAGDGFRSALKLLSDGAFKLFVYLCLHARRDTGVMHTTQTELARGLKKSHGTIRKHLREMEKTGICQIRFGHDPRGQGMVQIADLYWPYRQGGMQPATDASDAYVAAVRKMLDERACIRPCFSTADELLAREWFSHGVPLERIGQAILMGCGRKYVSWRNNQVIAKWTRCDQKSEIAIHSLMSWFGPCKPRANRSGSLRGS